MILDGMLESFAMYLTLVLTFQVVCGLFGGAEACAQRMWICFFTGLKMVVGKNL
jgi:hypothetical protein